MADVVNNEDLIKKLNLITNLTDNMNTTDEKIEQLTGYISLYQKSLTDLKANYDALLEKYNTEAVLTPKIYKDFFADEEYNIRGTTTPFYINIPENIIKKYDIYIDDINISTYINSSIFRNSDNTLKFNSLIDIYNEMQKIDGDIGYYALKNFQNFKLFREYSNTDAYKQYIDDNTKNINYEIEQTIIDANNVINFNYIVENFLQKLTSLWILPLEENFNNENSIIINFKFISKIANDTVEPIIEKTLTLNFKIPKDINLDIEQNYVYPNLEKRIGYRNFLNNYTGENNQQDYSEISNEYSQISEKIIENLNISAINTESLSSLYNKINNSVEITDFGFKNGFGKFDYPRINIKSNKIINNSGIIIKENVVSNNINAVGNLKIILGTSAFRPKFEIVYDKPFLDYKSRYRIFELFTNKNLKKQYNINDIYIKNKTVSNIVDVYLPLEIDENTSSFFKITKDDSHFKGPIINSVELAYWSDLKFANSNSNITFNNINIESNFPNPEENRRYIISRMLSNEFNYKIRDIDLDALNENQEIAKTEKNLFVLPPREDVSDISRLQFLETKLKLFKRYDNDTDLNSSKLKPFLLIPGIGSLLANNAIEKYFNEKIESDSSVNFDINNLNEISLNNNFVTNTILKLPFANDIFKFKFPEYKNLDKSIFHENINYYDTLLNLNEKSNINFEVFSYKNKLEFLNEFKNKDNFIIHSSLENEITNINVVFLEKTFFNPIYDNINPLKTFSGTNEDSHIDAYYQPVEPGYYVKSFINKINFKFKVKY